MTRAGFVASGLGLSALFAFATPLSAGPAVASRWQNAQMEQEDCLQRAEDAIRKTGLGRIERTEQSRYGSFEDYTGVVRCVTSNEIVLFIGSGPSRARADGLAGALFENFRVDKK